MLRTFRFSTLALVAGLAGVLAACSATPGNTASDADSGPTAHACVEKADCGVNEVCSGGICIQGECEKRQDCPYPDNQLCDIQRFKCIPDPDSPIGTECPAGNNDCDLGEFCFAGTCYATGDRNTCLRSSQCSPSERCDPTSGYCVPNLGGCDRCADYPELCCRAMEESCDPETKRCVAVVSGGTTCTVATQETDCRPGEHCLNARCVQCETDDQCGNGTICNIGTGRCVSANTCSSDDDCAQFTGRRCALSTHQCTIPQCTRDSECGDGFDMDERFRCNLDSFQCFLPPATCTETGEPNNNTQQATPLMGAALGTFSGSGTLCRGDMDYVSFPVTQGRRVEVTVTMTPGSSGQAEGIIADLFLPGSSAPAATTTFTYSTASRKLSQNLVADGTAHVRIASGSATNVDSWTWTVEVRFIEPLNCDTEAGEPNNTFATATPMTDTSFTRALCGDTDKDYFRFHVGASKRVGFRLEFDDDDHSLDFHIYTTGGSMLDSTFDHSSPIDIAYTTAAAQDLIIAVSNNASGDPILEALVYTITVTETDVPVCDDTAYEPNDSTSSAHVITPGVIHAVTCSGSDDDYYRFTLARASPISGSLSWLGNADLDVYIYDSDMDLVTSSSSSANPEEFDAAMLPAGTYYVSVQPFFFFGDEDYPVRYDLSLTAPGFCIDDTLDNEPGDDNANYATGIRDRVDMDLNYHNTMMHLCRADEDWFRVVALGNERISAQVTGLTGALVTVLESTSNGPRELGRSYNTLLPNGTPVDVVSVPVTPAAGIYYVRVSGAAASEGAYDLNIRVEPDPCDMVTGNDLEPNDAPANAIAALQGTNSGAFCPLEDRDIYKVQLSNGATLSAGVTFDATLGDVDLQLWKPGGAMPISMDADPDTSTMSTASVMTTATAAGQVNIVVLRKSGMNQAGMTYPRDPGQKYVLTVNITGGTSSSSSSGGAASSTMTVSSSAMAASSSAGGASSAAVMSSSMMTASSAETMSSSLETASSAQMASSMDMASSAEAPASSVDAASSDMGTASSL